MGYTQIDSKGATINGILDMKDYIQFSNLENSKTGLYWTTDNSVALTRKGINGGTVLTLSSSPSNQDNQGNLYLREINCEIYNKRR